MVPNLTKGAGIKGTALYVLHDERTLEEKAIGWELGEEYQSAHRRGFTDTRNLSTDNPDLAWRLMCATAKNHKELKQAAGIHKGGRQTEKFCGHMSLSWEHDAAPDKAEMLRAAEGALTALGWEKLQALIVEHTDHDHAHCHIVVNLIDPETGKAAPNAKGDYEKLQKWAFEYESQRGKIVCDRRAERMQAAEQEAPKPERRQWLPRKEWEAQRRAEREAAKAADAQQRRAIMAETMAKMRQNAADVREAFRGEWAALYREQRAELAKMDRQQAAQDRQLEKALGTHSGRVQFFNQHRDELWQALEGKQFATVEALTSPRTLTAAMQQAQAAQREQLDKMQAAAKADLAARVEAARHHGEREIWHDHKERVQAARDGDRAQAANANGHDRTSEGMAPPPVPPQYRREELGAKKPAAPEGMTPPPVQPHHRRETFRPANRYAGLNGRAAEDPARDPAPEKAAVDPYKDFKPIRESIRPDAPAPAPATPARSATPPPVDQKHRREEFKPKPAAPSVDREAAARQEAARRQAEQEGQRQAEAAKRAADAQRESTTRRTKDEQAAEKKRGEDLAAQFMRNHRGRPFDRGRDLER